MNSLLGAGLAAICFIGGSLIALSQEPRPNNAGMPSLEQLLQRIERLENRVKRLEERSAALAVPYRRPGPPSMAPEKRYQPPPSLPEGSKRKEFNGRPYYIVPLDSLEAQNPPPSEGR